MCSYVLNYFACYLKGYGNEKEKKIKKCINVIRCEIVCMCVSNVSTFCSCPAGLLALAKYSRVRLNANWVTEINSVRENIRKIYKWNASKSGHRIATCRRHQCHIYTNSLNNLNDLFIIILLFLLYYCIILTVNFLQYESHDIKE